MDKLEIRTCANIALVKYWGKADLPGNIPAVGSLSIGLEDLATVTHMGLADGESDRVSVNGASCGEAVSRVVDFLGLVRDTWDRQEYFAVETANNFPTGAGLASSASGFAALALGVNEQLSLGLSSKAISQLARQGSGSAARSVFGGFVEMKTGADAFASKIADATSWPLEVVIALTSTGPKDTGSTKGMELSKRTSPFYDAWVYNHETDLSLARTAVAEQDFQKLADVSEHSCLKMHGTMMASQPPLIYWTGTTVEVIHRVRALRAEGLPVFFTIDAGAQIKVVCLPGHARQLEEDLHGLPGVIDTIRTRVGGEPRISRGHG